MNRRKPIRHGTTGGYQAHFRHGVPMCEPCRAAERKRLGYKAPQRRAACGTASGYNAHQRRGETPCTACSRAHADDHRQYEMERRGDRWPYDLLVPEVARLVGEGLDVEAIAGGLSVSKLRVGRARVRARREGLLP